MVTIFNTFVAFCPQVLAEFKETKNCVDCCNKEGLMKFLEKQQSELELCEKALADYMESKRRKFPRFYFVSTADLLDILSNGNNPVKVQKYIKGLHSPNSVHFMCYCVLTGRILHSMC